MDLGVDQQGEGDRLRNVLVKCAHMAYLRKRHIYCKEYFYIVATKRLKKSGKTKQVTLEYLGRDPDPKRLRRALEYWGVKDKKGH